jgi:hypothetical protein
VVEIPDYGSRTDLTEEIIAQVEDLDPPIEIVPCDEESMAEALKDQILRRTPGRLGKGGDRTGAADSAVLRSVEAHSDKTGIAYVIVSNDEDIQKAIEEWGWDRTLYKQLRHAENALFKYAPAPAEAVLQVVRYLASVFDSGEWSSLVCQPDIELDVLERLFGEEKAEVVWETDVEFRT